MRPNIERLRLVSDASTSSGDLGAEFPTVFVSHETVLDSGDPVIDGAAWQEAASFRPFDEAVEQSGSSALAVTGGVMRDAPCEVLTRFQRFVDRRNVWSRSEIFDAALVAHRTLHDVTKPKGKADFDHALDTWQWLLRLAPKANLAIQLAALFHDIDRLGGAADDDQELTESHARRGAEQAYEVLMDVGVEKLVARRTRAIVAGHEKRGHDADGDLLNDADALSFFSLNSPGYLDCFGTAQTKKKILYSLGRLSLSARARVDHIRLRRDVAGLFSEVARS
jgi:hypothetical protein